MAGVVTEALAHHLQRLADEFKANRLAYLLLSSKDERLLCGMLASRLHETLAADQATLVRREWSVPTNRNQKIDIAVLRHNHPVALVEAKSAMSFDLVKSGKRPFPIKKVLDDVERLRAIDYDCERYILLFVTHYHELPRPDFDPALPYSKDRRRYGVINEVDFEAGFKRFHSAAGELPVLHRGKVSAGNAFDVDVTLYYWLFEAGVGRDGRLCGELRESVGRFGRQ